jgi:hypothetical protein
LKHVKTPSDWESISCQLLVSLPPDQLLVQYLDLDLLGRLEGRYERIDQGCPLMGQFVVLETKQMGLVGRAKLNNMEKSSKQKIIGASLKGCPLMGKFEVQETK